LVEEFLRVGIDVDFENSRFIDVQVIFHKMEKRTLEAAYRFYCNKELIDAHSANADTQATYEVLMSQLDHYPELQNDVEYLSKFTTYNRNVDYAGRIVLDDNGVEVFNFGKHKGKSVAEVFRVEPAYYSWMMNGDFPLFTKKVITNIRLRMR
jgi:DNA polymerase-3 subunit epsilon